MDFIIEQVFFFHFFAIHLLPLQVGDELQKTKEHLFCNAIHGIIESIDKMIIQKKDWFYGKYRSQCTFSVLDVL